MRVVPLAINLRRQLLSPVIVSRLKQRRGIRANVFPIQLAWFHAPGNDWGGPSNNTARWDTTESLLILLHCATAKVTYYLTRRNNPQKKQTASIHARHFYARENIFIVCKISLHALQQLIQSHVSLLSA